MGHEIALIGFPECINAISKSKISLHFEQFKR